MKIMTILYNPVNWLFSATSIPTYRIEIVLKYPHLAISTQLVKWCWRTPASRFSSEWKFWINFSPVKMRLKRATWDTVIVKVLKMDNASFSAGGECGEEIERALMDLGPLLGVTIKEETPDELADGAANRGNVCVFILNKTKV